MPRLGRFSQNRSHFVLEECGSGECPTSLIPEFLRKLAMIAKPSMKLAMIAKPSMKLAMIAKPNIERVVDWYRNS